MPNNGSTKVKEIVSQFYRDRPDMVPFSDGDRAVQLGLPSAEITVAGKLVIEEYSHGDNPTRFHRAHGKYSGATYNCYIRKHGWVHCGYGGQSRWYKRKSKYNNKRPSELPEAL